MSHITALIIERLNRDDSFDAGLCNRDAKLAGSNVVTFTFPAPVVSGAVIGTLTVRDDGSIHDDTSDDVFPNYAAWSDDLQSLMEV